MRRIQTYDFKHKRALIRVDFNVPLDAHYHVIDSTKIDRTLPTIRKVLNDGGSTVIISHLGRPQPGYQIRFSLQHLVTYLSDNLNTPVIFVQDCIGPEARKKAEQLRPGEVLLLENLRFHLAEEAADRKFGEALATLGDVYIQDAFAAAHRAHASMIITPQYYADRLAGFLLQEELSNADKILLTANKPFTAIIGGAKISDKVQVIERLMDKIDNLLLGGGVANTFQQALGGQLGNSLVAKSQIALVSQLFKQAQYRNINLVLPTDVVIATSKDEQTHTAIVPSKAIPAGWIALDIGPVSRKAFTKTIQMSHTILWSGPLGSYENQYFQKGTQAIAEAIAKATQQGAFSLIGGGDSTAAVQSFGYSNQGSYISTGGGALLAYLATPNLPVIQALY